MERVESVMDSPKPKTRPAWLTWRRKQQKDTPTMPRLIKSLDVLLLEFNTLKALLASNACDLQKLNEDFCTDKKALKWLRNNQQVKDDAERSQVEQWACITKSNWSKDKKFHRLETKIKQNMKEEAPERLFLMAADMFSGLNVESSLFSNFIEAAHCNHASSYLQQVLGKNIKMFCYDSVSETLDEALDYCGGCVDCSNMLHYNLLKDKFNSSHTLEYLHRILCEKLTDLFN